MDAQKLLDNFSTHLKSVIARSISLAARYGKKHVEPVHLLHALLEEHGSIGGELLKKASITPELVATSVPIHFTDQHTSSEVSTTTSVPDLSSTSRTVLEKALILAHDRGHVYIGTEHLLHGLILSKEKGIQEVWKAINFDVSELFEQLETSFQNAERFTEIGDVMGMFDDMQPPTPDIDTDEEDEDEDENEIDTTKNNKPSIAPASLSRDRKQQSATALFTTTLTTRQHTAGLDPVIGRENEIERMINILCRRTKNNPILVGEPGVGKTAIVEGLAKRIAEGSVPHVLKSKKILSLDLTLLVAGTIYRGEFEARLKQIIDESAKNPHTILFIDELHNIIGAGSNQGTMDAANILKPALARGHLRCIGATTYDEYKKYISSDPALERRFQKIDVEEPRDAEVLQILQGIKKYYESYHHVNILDSALEEAVTLSKRYIHDNFQPDKSIDLIDEASSSVKTKQKAPVGETRLYALERKREEYTEEKDRAIAEERLKDAAKFKDDITALDAKIASEIKKQKKQKKRATKAPEVSPTHIRDIVSKKLHINRDLLDTDEWQRLETLGDRLSHHIIGQDETLREVVETLKMSELGIRDKHKPYASFLFTGPSGVGKTELAKRLAEELYHDEKSLIRLDMGEFSEGHSVSKLLGSPAGYVGYKDRNPFIEKIKQRPYSVLLFDEIDKAHPDILKLLLQILDEGELHDTNGRPVKLTHSIVILTSNIGASLYKSQGIGFGAERSHTLAHRDALILGVTQQLKEHFSSALLSRLSSVCVFNQLSEDHVRSIIAKHVSEISDMLHTHRHISITPDDLAIDALVKDSQDKDLGARNIRRTIERTIEQLVVEALRTRTKQTYTLTRVKNTYSLT